MQRRRASAKASSVRTIPTTTTTKAPPRDDAPAAPLLAALRVLVAQASASAAREPGDVMTRCLALLLGALEAEIERWNETTPGRIDAAVRALHGLPAPAVAARADDATSKRRMTPEQARKHVRHALALDARLAYFAPPPEERTTTETLAALLDPGGPADPVGALIGHARRSLTIASAALRSDVGELVIDQVDAELDRLTDALAAAERFHYAQIDALTGLVLTTASEAA
jgi:hypothetical protein